MSFQNLLVVELASVLAGPSVGMFFAELGATVIKVENPRTGGDVTRSWKAPGENPKAEVSAYFSAINWGKKSLALDLRHPEARELLYRLSDKADVLISSFRPGSAEKLGMDAATLMARNPRLICAEVNGYGPEDPRPAFDAIIQAEAGFTYMNGEAGKGIYKMPVALMDVLAAHQLKEAVLLALIHRMQTGEGSRVSISLLEAGITSLANQAANWLVAGHLPQPIGSEHPNIAPYGTIFTCADGKALVLAVGNDRQFAALSDLLGLERLEAFATNPQRVQEREKLNALLAERIAGWKRDALLAELNACHVPAGAVNDLSEVMALPQAQDLLMDRRGLRGLRSIASRGIPLVSDPRPGAPPVLGAHTREILSGQLGCSEEELAHLSEKGVIRSK